MRKRSREDDVRERGGWKGKMEEVKMRRREGR